MDMQFGNSVFSAEGEKHRAMRKMLNPAYTLNATKESATVLMDLAADVRCKCSDW
jgi:cytochrome P450